MTSTNQELFCVPCHRQPFLDGSVPFIKTMDQKFSIEPEEVNENEIIENMGVRFAHEPQNNSPHVSQTHIETSHHVLVNGTKLSQVKPIFSKHLSAAHILVHPMLVNTTHGDTKQYKTAEGKLIQEVLLHFTAVDTGEELADTYTMFRRDGTQFDKDRIVTECMIHKALGSHMFPNDELDAIDVIMIQFEGGELEYENWPFFTDQAIQSIMQHQFKAVVLNIPSMDRENDGGRASNHKTVFKNLNNVIIELADLTHLSQHQSHRGSVMITIAEQMCHEDCSGCSLTFTPIVTKK
jgi:kynurenine formamidase